LDSVDAILAAGLDSVRLKLAEAVDVLAKNPRLSEALLPPPAQVGTDRALPIAPIAPRCVLRCAAKLSWSDVL
jgi:hypothetical protein